MEKKLFSLKQPLSVSAMIDATMTFTRLNIRNLLPASVLSVLPVAIAMALVLSQWISNIPSLVMLPDNDGYFGPYGLFSLYPIVFILFNFMWSALLSIGFTAADDFAHKREALGPMQLLKAGMSKLFNTFGMLLVLQLMLAVIMFLLIFAWFLIGGVLAAFGSFDSTKAFIVIIPGLLVTAGILFYLSVSFSMAPVINYFGHEGYFKAISRSRKLIKGRFWLSTGNYVLLYIIIAVAVTVFSMPAQIYMLSSVFSGIESSNPDVLTYAVLDAFSDPVFLILSTISSLGMLLYIMLPLMMSVMYFSYREEDSQEDLISRIDTVTGENTTAPMTGSDVRSHADSPPAPKPWEDGYKMEEHSGYMPGSGDDSSGPESEKR